MIGGKCVQGAKEVAEQAQLVKELARPAQENAAQLVVLVLGDNEERRPRAISTTYRRVRESLVPKVVWMVKTCGKAPVYVRWGSDPLLGGVDGRGKAHGIGHDRALLFRSGRHERVCSRRRLETKKEDRREQRRCSAGGLGPTYVDDPHGRDDADEGDAHHEGDAQHQARLGEGVGRAQHTHAQRVVYQKGT